MKNHVQTFFFGIIGNVTGAETSYPQPGSAPSWTAAKNGIYLSLTRGGTLKGLWVGAKTAPGGSVVDTITVQVDGGDTAITCTLTGAQTLNGDSTHTQTVTLHQAITIKYVAGAGSVASGINCSVEVENDN